MLLPFFVTPDLFGGLPIPELLLRGGVETLPPFAVRLLRIACDGGPRNRSGVTG